MRNLKKALSLVLACVMLLGMMVMTTGAADFTDSDEIANTEAVNTCVALNIINGKGDGSYFDPTGIVTRGEMAKMICVALNGGKDPNLGTDAYSFTDTVGHWAAGYIEYCANLNIIGGRGNGIFDPNATVTGTEAAKMLLVAIGYDSEAEGFTGASWAIAVNTLASQKDFYDELGGLNPSAGLSRDNAAQMVYNAINAVKVKYEYKLVTGSDGQLTTKGVAEDVTTPSGKTTIAGDKFDLRTGYGYMTGAITYANSSEKYTYTLNTTTGSLPASIRSKVDYSSLYGLYVKVLWKDDTDKTVYSIIAEDSSVIATGYNGNLSTFTANKSVKLGSTTYDIDTALTSIPVIQAISGTAAGTYAGSTSTITGVAAPYKVALIDNDDDDRVDTIVVTPFTVAKVTYVGADSITFGGGIGSQDKDDIVYYDGIAKDDYALFTPAANAAKGKGTAVKAAISTGTITGTKDSPAKFLIDGSWYTNSSGTSVAVNDTVDYIGFGGYLYYAKVTEVGATSRDVAMVITAAHVTATGVEAAKIQAKLLLADGTKSVVTVSKMNSGTPHVDAAPVGTNNDAQDVAEMVGQLVTYRTDSDNKYELTEVSGTNLAGHKGFGSAAAYTNKLVGGKELADDAVVYVLKGSAGAVNTTNDGKVYTGKELKNAYGSGTYGTAGGCLYDTVSGFEYAKTAVISHSALPTITSASNFGYLTADAYESYEGSDTYRNFSVWDGTTTLTVKEKASGLTGLKAGTVITYDVVSDTVIKNVSVAPVATSVVTGWDGDEKISIAALNGNSKIDSDTVVLYVNSKDKKGVAGGSIAIGEDLVAPYDVADQNNVRYIGTTTALELLVVDVNNKMEVNPSPTTQSDTFANLGNQAGIQALLNSGFNVTVTDGITLTATGFTVPAGYTLTTTALSTAALGATVNGSVVATTSVTAATAAITGTGSITTALIADTATAALLQNKTIKLTATAAIATLEAMVPVLGQTLILDAASTGSATASTWYTSTGSLTSAGVSVAGATLPAAPVPADTYVGSTVYTDTVGTTAVKWLQQ